MCCFCCCNRFAFTSTNSNHTKNTKNKSDDDLNSVFDTDNHTTCSSGKLKSQKFYVFFFTNASFFVYWLLAKKNDCGKRFKC